MPGAVTSSARPQQLLIRILTWLPVSRYFPLFIAALAIVLGLPSLATGLILDDLYHREVLQPNSAYRDLLGPPSEMFCFFRGDPVRTERIMDLGAFPWWTDPILKAEFLQAIPTLTHRLDYALWPRSPALMHAHSLFWLGTAVAAAALFYRRMFGPTWVAAAAALLFAVDDARGTTVGFIANRNVLIAATFGFSALICHDRWRRSGSTSRALIAAAFLSLALLSKEEGIGTCAYLAAYALCVDPKGVLRGLLTLVPYAAIVVIWRTVRDWSGYGVQNVGVYVDPVTDPGLYLSALASRLPVMLFGQWGPFPSESAGVLHEPYFTAFLCLAVSLVVLLFFVTAPLLKRDPLARFWAAGMVFAAVPVCATLPMDRLFTFVGLGAFGLLAQFWELVFTHSGEAPVSPWWRVPARAFAWFCVVVHAIWAPVFSPMRATSPIGPFWVEERMYVNIPLEPSIAEKTLVVVNAPSVAHASYFPFRQLAAGKSVPRHVRVLAPAVPSVIIRRADEHTLAITPRRGYLDFVLDQVFRSELRPLALGEEVKLTGMTARVAAINTRKRPNTVTFRFDEPLESRSFVWLCFRGDGFVPFALPAIGEETEIRFDWAAMFKP